MMKLPIQSTREGAGERHSSRKERGRARERKRQRERKKEQKKGNRGGGGREKRTREKEGKAKRGKTGTPGPRNMRDEMSRPQTRRRRPRTAAKDKTPKGNHPVPASTERSGMQAGPRIQSLPTGSPLVSNSPKGTEEREKQGWPGKARPRTIHPPIRRDPRPPSPPPPPPTKPRARQKPHKTQPLLPAS